jgi:6-phosphofructokinase 1
VAMIEARAGVSGVGLVGLMGRHSGFIACYAALANHVADFVLIPEVPFGLTGQNGFLCTLHQRLKERGSAVVVVAEGAGQDIMAVAARTGPTATDASGNVRLSDIGLYLNAEITTYFADQGSPLMLKHFDPGCPIRSVPADPHDAVYCLRLAQAARTRRDGGRVGKPGGRSMGHG